MSIPFWSKGQVGAVGIDGLGVCWVTLRVPVTCLFTPGVVGRVVERGNVTKPWFLGNPFRVGKRRGVYPG